MELLSVELKDKAAYITFTLQVSKSALPQELQTTRKASGPLRKKEISTSGWMSHVQHCGSATQGRYSLTAYETAMEDNCTDLEDKTLMVPMIIKHINDSLLAVTSSAFQHCARETQKQWTSKYVRKPYSMGAKQFTTSMSRINNYFPFLPNATVLSKYSEEGSIGILEVAVPSHWRKAFDLRDYLSTSDDKARGLSVSVSV
jgi:hypothetical protein